MTVRFDPAGAWEIGELDVPFAKPEGRDLLARIYRPRGALPGADTDRCVALMREFIGRQIA